MSVIHQNVQSLGNSVNRVEDMIQNNPDCKFLCLTEHWKTEDQLKMLPIKEFNLCSCFCREEGEHGGVAVYVHKTIKSNCRKNLNEWSLPGVFECAVAECTLAECQIIIVSLYRPPSGNVSSFFDKLEGFLTCSVDENKRMVIAGDFNIELLINKKLKAELESIMSSFNFTQVIKENTRITASSARCIDGVFVNFTPIKNSSIINAHISDHMAQKVTFILNKQESDKHIYKRFFSEKNKTQFLTTIRNQDWSEIFCVDDKDVNKQWNMFVNSFKNIFNESFPLCYTRKNFKFNKRKAVMKTPEIIECKNRLDILLTLSNNKHEFKTTYNKTKREYENLLASVKKKQLDSRLATADNKNKCMWDICREITGGKVNRDIQIEGNAEEIADRYNQYLTDVIQEVLKKMGNVTHVCQISGNNQSLFLAPTTPTEIQNLMKALNNKMSSGDDEIPTSIVKISISQTCTVLSHVVNNSLRYGIFPDRLKLALIKPLHKGGNKQELKNYRPISLLSSFSKIFEIIACNRIMNFFNRCDLFTHTQHGFLKGRSTQTAIFEFIQKIVGWLENGSLALGMFIDLSRAYDCIDHSVLYIKLEKYGVRGNALEWIKSYLSSRQQRVVVNKDGRSVKSGIIETRVGIPQGSIIGPVIFLIYINDLGDIVGDVNEGIINYADDTNLLVGGKSVPEVINAGRDLFHRANEWFMGNKLMLNTDKTNTIVFRTKQSHTDRPPTIPLDQGELETNSQTKFLGIILDEFLDWNPQTVYVGSKLNKICYGIRVVAKYVTTHTLRTLYFANFESVARYGIIFWGRSASMQSIFVIQKRVIRIIYGKKYRESCRGTFKSNRIMTIYALYIYESLLFFIKNRNRFEHTASTHGYNTRTVDLYYPYHSLTLTEKCAHYMVIKFYNKLPDSIKRMQFRDFKIHIKQMLVELEPYSINDYLGFGPT